MKVVVAVLLLAGLASVSDAGRILAIFPSSATSHLNVLFSVVNGLAEKGHDVTVISVLPQKNLSKNIKLINLNIQPADVLDKANFFVMGEATSFGKLLMLFGLGKAMCDSFLSKPQVQEFMKTASTDQYDVLITENFFNECVLGFAHIFQIPTIQICPFGGLESTGGTVGNPFSYAYISNFQLNYGTHMTFCERLHNSIVGMYEKLARKYIHMPEQNRMMQKYFGDAGVGPLPHVRELETKTSLILLNNHVSLNYARPYMPNIIEVGGVHIKPTKPLPADLQQFLDSAKDGVIYFSMGSILKSSELAPEKKAALLQAFGALKQKVLWKWEDDVLPGQPKNVKLGKWFPQSDLLAHPYVKIFITHGGLLSTQESLYHGKPVIGIPIFGDQKMNMNQAVQSGYGYLLPIESITTETVSKAINTVLTEPQYKESAERISRIFRDTPRTPLETAVFWSEYVMRHKGAYHMRSAALDLAWYQYYLLDVLAVLGGGTLLVLALVFLMLRTLVRCCLPKKKANAHDKKRN